MTRGLFSQHLPTPTRYARILLQRGIDHPEGLTYAVPAEMADLEPGERVEAPLGRANRPVEGIVLEILPAAAMAIEGVDPDRIKPILRRTAPNDAPGSRTPPNLMSLASWIAQYYVCPIGMVLATMVPAAVRRQVGRVARTVLTVSDAGQHEELTTKARQVLERLRSLGPLAEPIEPITLADRLGEPTLAGINRLVRAGFLIRSVQHGIESRTEPMLHAEGADPGPPPMLTPPQQRAVHGVIATLGTFAPHLLWGVTGSGKTEVYLRSIETAIRTGGSAVVLVPEISLTPQTAARFLSRFREAGVAVLHSGLSDSQRHEQWSRVAGGGARVVVGARSAIFAPFPPGVLRLIVVDEEHDSSYKQDQLPRYHGRDVAIKRAQLESCPVLLGSATPALESWRHAQEGRYTLHELPGRVGGGAMPPVQVLDMFEENRARPRSARAHLHALGPTLESEIARTLARQGQIILLLNRRGYASYICCADASCGWYLTCKHCDVTAVHHRERTRGASAFDVVKCHHCQAEQKPPSACPSCGKSVNTFGFGTQRLEEELERKFSALRLGETMLRLDGDTMRRAADYFTALERFRTGSVRLLLGTQMIAKGLDFPGVELVGVINADAALALPDFRSEERTFQLVSQVAGRAGRSAESGAVSRVVVQTFSPGAWSIRCAARHDYRAFAEKELASRRQSGLPPVTRMARLVCRDEQHDKALARAHEIAQSIRAISQPDDDLRVRGPMPCPIARIAGFHRVSIELLAPSPGPIQRVIARLRGEASVRSDARTAIDVDPIALL